MGAREDLWEPFAKSYGCLYAPSRWHVTSTMNGVGNRSDGNGKVSLQAAFEENRDQIFSFAFQFCSSTSPSLNSMPYITLREVKYLICLEFANKLAGVRVLDL